MYELINSLTLIGFLYFPENKMEYIPAAFSMVFFLILAILTYKWFKTKSQKDEVKMKAFEDEIMKQLEREDAHGRGL